jgi:RNA polymerase sigma-70 factor (family 1)
MTTKHQNKLWEPPCSQENEHAFQLIFQQYRHKVYKMAFACLKTSAGAEEILQDVFLKLWIQKKPMNSINSLEAWLHTVTRNSIRNSLRKRAFETAYKTKLYNEKPLAENTTDHKIIDAQDQALIQAAIARLSKQQQAVYLLAKETGFSYKQIGKKLSLSPLTVKKHMARALETLREFLKQNGETVVSVLLFAKTIC